MDVTTIARRIIGIVFLCLSVYLTMHFGGKYLNFLERIYWPADFYWHMGLWFDEFFPQLILSLILMCSSVLFIFNKRPSYYLFLISFIGAIIDISYSAFIRESTLRGLFIEFYLPFVIAILCLFFIHHKIVFNLFKITSINYKYVVIAVCFAVFNTLHTRVFNTILVY